MIRRQIYHCSQGWEAELPPGFLAGSMCSAQMWALSLSELLASRAQVSKEWSNLVHLAQPCHGSQQVEFATAPPPTWCQNSPLAVALTTDHSLDLDPTVNKNPSPQDFWGYFSIGVGRSGDGDMSGKEECMPLWENCLKRESRDTETKLNWGKERGATEYRKGKQQKGVSRVLRTSHLEDSRKRQEGNGERNCY